MHNFKNGSEQTYGDNNFVPLEERTALTNKRFFSALEGQQNLTGYLVFDKKR